MDNSKEPTNPVMTALREAEAIVKGAREKAREVMQQAEIDAQTLKDQARKEGALLGKKEVVQASLKFFRDHEVLAKKLQKEASILAYEIVKKIFNYEDKSILDPIQLLAKKLFETSGAERSITLITNPYNAERLKGLSQHINSLSGLKFILKESQEVNSDTLVMRSELGEVQVSLTDLLAELATFLNIRT